MLKKEEDADFVLGILEISGSTVLTDPAVQQSDCQAPCNSVWPTLANYATPKLLHLQDYSWKFLFMHVIEIKSKGDASFNTSPV